MDELTAKTIDSIYELVDVIIEKAIEKNTKHKTLSKSGVFGIMVVLLAYICAKQTIHHIVEETAIKNETDKLVGV
jgi:hypothetical protein